MFSPESGRVWKEKKTARCQGGYSGRSRCGMRPPPPESTYAHPLVTLSRREAGALGAGAGRVRCCSPPPYPPKAFSPPGGPSARPEVSLMVLADGVGRSRGIYIPVPAVPLQVLTGLGARPGASSRPRGPSPPSPARPLFPGRPARGGAVSRGPLAWATVTGSLPHTFRPLCGLTFHPTTPPPIPSGSPSSRP